MGREAESRESSSWSHWLPRAPSADRCARGAHVRCDPTRHRLLEVWIDLDLMKGRCVRRPSEWPYCERAAEILDDMFSVWERVQGDERRRLIAPLIERTNGSSKMCLAASPPQGQCERPGKDTRLPVGREFMVETREISTPSPHQRSLGHWAVEWCAQKRGDRRFESDQLVDRHVRQSFRWVSAWQVERGLLPLSRAGSRPRLRTTGFRRTRRDPLRRRSTHRRGHHRRHRRRPYQ